MTAQEWWGKRRLLYNAGLIVAGMASMTLLAGILELSKCQFPDLEAVPMDLVYRALWYFAAMLVANVIYSLAPRVESRLPAERVAGFRKWAFGLGFGLSISLPFLFPLIFLGRCPQG